MKIQLLFFGIAKDLVGENSIFYELKSAETVLALKKELLLKYPKLNMKNTAVLITSEKLKVQDCYDFVQDAACGGIALFVGTVRNSTKNKEVSLLDFSAYEPMALKEMQKIADLALAKFQIHKIAIH